MTTVQVERLKRRMVRQRCTCDQADICDLSLSNGPDGHETPHRYVRGRTDPKCPQHGKEARPEPKLVWYYPTGPGDRSLGMKILNGLAVVGILAAWAVGMAGVVTLLWWLMKP